MNVLLSYHLKLHMDFLLITIKTSHLVDLQNSQPLDGLESFVLCTVDLDYVLIK
jgi:hypothetical protein